jgi:hypothetical protein
MSKKSTPVPRPAQSWYFRDRNGRRFGPYTEPKEVRAILTNHCVGKTFDSAIENLAGIVRWSTEFIMEDAEHNAVCPGDWLDVEKEKRRKVIVAIYKKRHGQHVHRSGPVAGIHKLRYSKMWRTPDFGRKVRDTGHGCVEDGEPPIRVRLRANSYCWDDFAPNRTVKSWKRYRDHQWRVIKSKTPP